MTEQTTSNETIPLEMIEYTRVSEDIADYIKSVMDLP